MADAPHIPDWIARLIADGAKKGHRCKVEPTPSGRRWQLTCACGWSSRNTYAVRRTANAAATRHLLDATAGVDNQRRRNGVSRGQRRR